MAAAVFALLCCGLVAGAHAASLSPERLLSEVRLLAPELPAPSALSWLQVPTVAPAPAAPTAVDPRTIYDRITSAAVKLKALSAEERRGLFDAAFRHPVAGLDDEKKLNKYDPQGFIGFCFGRAMAVHLLSRQMGLAEGSVRQLFVVGDLREGDEPQWRFHVTALVKGEEGAWYAMDPIMEGPMTAAAWLAEVRKTWDKGRKAKLYMTPASTVLPDVTVVPEPGQETGTRLIELSFDPAGKAGFSPAVGLGDEVFAVSAEAASKYFQDAAGAFDFEGIPVNGERISYNGYFVDLLRDIAAGAQRLMPYGAPRLAGPKARPLGLRMAPSRR